MTYKAIEFLKKFVNKNLDIFEFGSGSSTLFFAKNARSVTSLETNPRWADIITTKLDENQLENFAMHLMPDGIDNENYESFLKKTNKKFDIIIIDSIKRYKCALNSLDYLSKNGIIILDDSERKNYQKIFTFFKGQQFLRQDFDGISPGQLRIKKTTIFTRFC